MKGDPEIDTAGGPADRDGQLGGLADEALVELVRAGEERAFEALVLRYRLPLRSYCMRLGVSSDAAEDVLQQVLLEAWLALRDGVEVRIFKAWLYRVAHNVAVDAIRATPRVAALSPEQAEREAAGATMFEPEAQEALTAVAALPLLQREAIVRTALAGESHEQVGHYLGLTAGAVRGLIYRGRATLRSALAALVPPWLPRLIASRSGASGGMRESLSGLAATASNTGAAGALVKAGVIAAVAATAITTAVPAQSTHPRHPHRSAAAVASPQLSAPRRSTRTPGAAASLAMTRSRRGAGGSRGSRDANVTIAPVHGPSASTNLASEQALASKPESGAATTAEPATTQAAGGQPVVSATTVATAPSGSTTAAASTEAASQTPSSGSSTQPASPSAGVSPTPPASGEQTGTASASGSSGSGSSEHGGLVGEIAHTVEHTLETTVEGTLGKLLHH